MRRCSLCVSLFPYTTLFRSIELARGVFEVMRHHKLEKCSAEIRPISFFLDLLGDEQIQEKAYRADFCRTLFQLMVPHDFKDAARQLDRSEERRVGKEGDAE